MCMPVSVCVCVCVPCVYTIHGDQKKVLHSLVLRLQVAVSDSTWLKGSKLGCSGRRTPASFAEQSLPPLLARPQLCSSVSVHFLSFLPTLDIISHSLVITLTRPCCSYFLKCTFLLQFDNLFPVLQSTTQGELFTEGLH